MLSFNVKFLAAMLALSMAVSCVDGMKLNKGDAIDVYYCSGCCQSSNRGPYDHSWAMMAGYCMGGDGKHKYNRGGWEWERGTYVSSSEVKKNHNIAQVIVDRLGKVITVANGCCSEPIRREDYRTQCIHGRSAANPHGHAFVPRRIAEPGSKGTLPKPWVYKRDAHDRQLTLNAYPIYVNPLTNKETTKFRPIGCCSEPLSGDDWVPGVCIHGHKLMPKKKDYEL